MGETLDALDRLQGVEIKLAALRQGREAKARQVDARRRILKKAEEKLQERLHAIRDLKVRIDQITLELASKEEAISKHREGLNKAKTNKDYAAILAAMNTEKADNSKQETDLQKLLEELQTLQAGETAIQTELQIAQADVARTESAVAAYDSQTSAETGRLTASRNQLAANVPAHAIAIFTRVAERHEGEALASVVKVHPKRDEYCCSGCNISLALDEVNLLMTRDDIRICQNCGRILYLQSSGTFKSAS